MMKRILFPIFLFFIICFSLKTQAQSYLLIVSSQPSKAKALNEVEMLQASGFVNAGMLYHAGTKRYRVYLNVYESKESAEEDAQVYRDSYKKSWIYKSEYTILPNEESELTPTTTKKVIEEIQSQYEMIQSDLSETKKSNAEIKMELATIKDEISQLTNLVNELQLRNDGKMEVFDDQVKQLGKSIKSVEEKNEAADGEIENLSQRMEEVKTTYVKSSDTVSYSWKVVRKKFDFGKPKLSFGVGVVQSSLYSTISDYTQTYYNINSNKIPGSFWGVNLSGAYHFTKKWIAEVNLKTYLSNSNIYLFPSLDIKFSQQIGRLPLRINPCLGVGSEVLFYKNASLKGARYVFYNPGFELEYGLSKRFSLFGKCRYGIISHSENKEFQFDKSRELDLIYGIRLSIQ